MKLAAALRRVLMAYLAVEGVAAIALLYLLAWSFAALVTLGGFAYFHQGRPMEGSLYWAIGTVAIFANSWLTIGTWPFWRRAFRRLWRGQPTGWDAQ